MNLQKLSPFVARIASAVFVAAVGIFGVACPGGSSEGRAPVDTCEEIGQRCRLDDGKVGICTMKPDDEFQCVPQH